MNIYDLNKNIWLSFFGRGKNEKESFSVFGGIRLHARSLSFPHPANSDNRITVQADPPLRDNLWQAFSECTFAECTFAECTFAECTFGECQSNRLHSAEFVI